MAQLTRYDCLKIIAEVLLECAEEERRRSCPEEGNDGQLTLDGMARVAKRMCEQCSSKLGT